MPFARRSLLLAVLLASTPAAAEITLKSQAQADLDVMRSRAATLGDQGDAMRMLDRLTRDGGRDPVVALQDLLGIGRDGKLPIRYQDTMLANAAAQ
ncbi:MAG TPA: hypothetical protein PLM52_19465, partial [Tabrizicola sp.]|nr:hypothetical protein [Tabrizicola sp.]